MSKLITLTLLKNEKGRYLSEFLDALKTTSDYAIFLDNGSDDGTKEMLQEYLKNNAGCLIEDRREFAKHEAALRELLWEECRKIGVHGDWCYVVDADEIPMPEFKELKSKLGELNSAMTAVAFRKVELWNETEYRVDSLWSNYFLRMFRFRDEPWAWPDYQGLHCNPLPMFAMSGQIVCYNSNVRIQHLAYKTPELRAKKAAFMKEHGNKNDKLNYNHLLTTEDSNPRLKKLTEIQDFNLPVTVIVVANDCYTINPVLEKLKLWNCNKTLTKLIFLVSNSSCTINDELIAFKEETGWDIDELWIKFADEDYGLIENRPVEKTLAQIKKKIQGDFVFLLDANCDYHGHNVLQHLIGSDRDVLLLRSVTKISNRRARGVFMTKMAFDKLDLEKVAQFTGGNIYDRVLNYYNAMKVLIWDATGIPHPINCNLITDG